MAVTHVRSDLRPVGRGRHSWTGALPAIAVLMLGSVLGGCSSWSDSEDVSDEAVPAEERLTGEALCAEAFQGQNQRPAADFTPATAVDSKPEVVSLLGVGTTPDGFCLDTGTEFHGSPWEIATITVTASLLGDGMSESRHSRTTAWDNERLPFFVPADGCTQVSGTIELIHPETGETRTWTAAEVFHPRRRGACDEVSGDGEPSPS